MADIGSTAAGDADARADRHHHGRVRDEDPREVPARARERGVGPAARARPSCARSCAPTREYLGLDPKMLVEEYKQRFERPGPQDLMPFSARGRGRGASRARRVSSRRGRSSACASCCCWAPCSRWARSATTSSGETEVTPTPTATPSAAGRAAKKRQEDGQAAQTPAAPKKVALQIVPEADGQRLPGRTRPGEPLIRSENLTEARPTSTAPSGCASPSATGRCGCGSTARPIACPTPTTRSATTLRPGRRAEARCPRTTCPPAQ